MARSKTKSVSPTRRSAPSTKRAPSNEAVPVETCPSFRSGHLPNLNDVKQLRELTAPHVESFDYFLDYGLSQAIKDIEPVELAILDYKKVRENDDNYDYSDVSCVKFWLEDARVRPPVRGDGSEKRLLPRECRERRLGYNGNMTATFCFQIIDRRGGHNIPGKIVRLPRRNFGDVPICVLSKACHLRGMSPKQLAAVREEHNEAGGYFVVKGNEKCARLLQVPRRNHPTAIQRSNYKNRGVTYTDLGVAIKCSRHNGDQTSITNTVHYLTTGGSSLRFSIRRQEFLVPVVLILRALSGGPGKGRSVGAGDIAGGSDRLGGGVTDEELYQRIVQGDENNTFLVARAGLLLQDARARFPKLNTPEECLAFIGSRFRRISLLSPMTSDVEVGHFIIRRFIQVHVDKYSDKLESVLLLLRKLYSFAAGDTGADNADSLQNQELLLPGHLLCAVVKEKFEEFLLAFRTALYILLRKDFARNATKVRDDHKFWDKQIERASSKSSGGIGKKVQNFLATGTLQTTTGLDLMQTSGFTIIAERLNFLRFCAHFRSVHRGQFFTEMRTTGVRKLLPDQWGFMCPVHTPDGGLCGLLSHLSLKTKMMTYPSKTNEKGMKNLDEVLISLGVSPVGAGGESGAGNAIGTKNMIPVCIDGRVIGGATALACKTIAAHLRTLKVAEPPVVPPTLEAAFIPPGNRGSPYPGLYLFTLAARMVRPVLHRASGKMEQIGPLEQGFMDIACLNEDIREGITTHQELDPTDMLSLIANLTPFSDQNQSPRNMYQCQMGKQTMGTPCHSIPYRSDNKLYRLQTPQAPIVQTSVHGKYKMDEYPNGTNAVVAVLSYTGFDMEDAMILNKSSCERGFGHASIYKNVIVNLEEEGKRAGVHSSEADRLRFANKGGGSGRGKDQPGYESIEADGFPKVGDRLTEGDPYYCIVDTVSGSDRYGKHKERDVAYIQSVRMLGADSGKASMNSASITLRFPRKPVIGDKFSSRHGQKGVLSIHWPQADMPFSESGISPDIIINPHAFPSRMTIGMLVESMAGKSGALHGHYQDATPFTFHESGDKVSIDYFGEQLQAAGYNYYGSEALYSGVSGCVMHADLYIGVVYYQRLRHMVSDKYQVRATGPINDLTRQPVKGRKRGGGIRLGEMERDSLLSHGAAFLLQDRLLNCSDKHIAHVCTRCGDLLLPTTERSIVQTTGQSASDAVNKPKLRMYCKNRACMQAVEREDCNDEAVEPIILPYVYRYLINELAGMNIKVKMEIK